MKTILPGQTIGIIGGGQLGRMMGLAAKEAGFKIAVLDPTMDSPCGQIADIRIVAPYDDEAALEELGEVSDVITYEFENIDYEGLERLSQIAYVPQGAESCPDYAKSDSGKSRNQGIRCSGRKLCRCNVIR